MLRVGDIITNARKQLNNRSTSKVDIEWLLAHVMHVNRAKLYAFPEVILSQTQWQAWQLLFARCLAGEPVAYLLGEQEFWSLPFKVTPDVLIPRPETELLVEWMLTHLPANQRVKIADLGTGSGAIACSLAKERPNWQLTATDNSQAALLVAQENTSFLQVTEQVTCVHGNWFEPLLGEKFAAIVSNPPYIEPADSHLAALRYEPQSALVAAKKGFADLQHIIRGAGQHLIDGGYLLLEHGHQQQEDLIAYLKRYFFENIQAIDDFSGQPRMVAAQYGQRWD